MRARNALSRLAAAAPSAEPVLDAGEEDRILAGILTSPRRAADQRPLALALVGIAVIGAAAIAASLGLRHSHPSAARRHHHHVALTGARIQMAGYHFKTPAGFAASKESCMTSDAGNGRPEPAVDGFGAAAEADGACVEAAYIVAADWLETHDPIPDSATAVDVGDYSGYYVPATGSSDESSLYVALPHADGQRVVYVLLVAHGVPEDELIAIAASGLPTLPPQVQPATTTG